MNTIDANEMDGPGPGEERIPRADWDRAPWNRYTFYHVRDWVRTTPVARGAASPRAWPEARQDIGGVAFEIDGRRQTMNEFLDSSYTDGFLVLHRGRLIAERYENGMTSSSTHLLQSVSKSVTGTLAGILIGRGQMRSDTLLTHYLPELEATAYRGATLQHVLDMSSGVAWDENYTAPDSHMAQMDAACGWKARMNEHWPECMWDLVLTLRESCGEHGATFSYRSIETDVLGFVIERITGMRLAELVSCELWAPMGAEADAYFSVDSSGFACACGGFNTTLRDLARFAQLFATEGSAGGRPIVPVAWIEKTRRGDHEVFRGAYREVLPDGAYRHQFWIEDAARRALIGRGVFGQLIYIDPGAQFVAVKFSSWPVFVDANRSRTALTAVRALRDALSG